MMILPLLVPVLRIVLRVMTDRECRAGLDALSSPTRH
jgi:hypothetical protein